jgi:hypothetical protein
MLEVRKEPASVNSYEGLASGKIEAVSALIQCFTQPCCLTGENQVSA